MLIAHLSDAHIGPLPAPALHDLLGKRLTGYLNWQRGRWRTHDMGLLARMLEDIRSQQPDHIAMTGDIANIGLAEEFPAGQRFLASLGSPETVSFVPGNHDAYVVSSMPIMQEALGPWMSGDKTEENSLFPYLKRRNDIALIGLSSGNPTLPFLATGTLGKAQLAALEMLLTRLGDEGLCRVVMVHHPPYRGGAKFTRRLTDAVAFERVIAKAGAELILHGHNHRSMFATILGPQGASVPIIGAPSVSAISGTADHRAGYHLINIQPSGKNPVITVTTRGYDPETGAIHVLEDRQL